ncbi:jg100, partial [Pararge aegeria aegeria]
MSLNTVKLYTNNTKLSGVADVNSLMYFHDLILPGNAYHYHEFDAINVLNNDLDMELEGISIIESKKPPKISKFDKLRPVLKTMMPSARRPSQTESILALNKRNMAVPELDGLVDPHALGERLVSQFVNSYVDKENLWLLEEYKRNPIKPNVELVEDWLMTQKPDVRKLIDGPDDNLEDRRWNNYKFMIKPTVKPALDLTAPYTN